MSIRRFEYREEMGFFKIEDKEGVIPTCFVDTKEEADKLTNFFKTLNPKIDKNVIILKWQNNFTSNIFLNQDKMDKIEIKIKEDQYQTGKEIHIIQKGTINLRGLVEENKINNIFEQLDTIPCIKEFMNNHSYVMNKKFFLIEDLALEEEEKNKVLNEIIERFPSVSAYFIERFSDNTFDLIIKF